VVFNPIDICFLPQIDHSPLRFGDVYLRRKVE
jgi:hypothetical protein